MDSPVCAHCKLPMVLLHNVPATELRQGKTVFECKSCFRIRSEPVSYALKPAPSLA